MHPGNEETGWVRRLRLQSPSLQNNIADADRLGRELSDSFDVPGFDIDLSLWRRLPSLLRKTDFRLRCVAFKDRRRGVLVAAQDPDDPQPTAGLAIDLGTTRVALRLLDLQSGRTLGERGFENPQTAIAPDILARIHHCDRPAGLRALHERIVDQLNRESAGLCENCGLSRESVYLTALAGNTAMTHLFMGTDPRWMIREPYIPAVNRPGLLKAGDLGLALNPAARVFVFPNIGSYFGGDLIAGILACDLHRRRDPAILVDVGTNAEVVLGNRDWLMGCAGAAGPALEGGVTHIGMTAGAGAIDRVEIDPASRKLSFHTIGGGAPVGICGSGIIDLAAGLLLAGMIDIRGRLRPEACGRRLIEREGMRYLVVVPAAASASQRDLTISQADIDSLVRSKAAMYTILETLTTTVGVPLTELDPFYVAGTFGTVIRPRSAVAIGMLPDLPAGTYRAIGNTSLEGAARVLSDAAALEAVDEIRDRITYLELNVNQEFMNRFSAAKFLPHTDAARFPSVRLPGKSREGFKI
jgi:uncharacterized 2Fe-2S/4Fe-4S cluster protein (DUF4445 family)